MAVKYENYFVMATPIVITAFEDGLDACPNYVIMVSIKAVIMMTIGGDGSPCDFTLATMTAMIKVAEKTLFDADDDDDDGRDADDAAMAMENHGNDDDVGAATKVPIDVKLWR